MHSPPSQPESAQTPLQLPHLCTSCTSPNDILQQSSNLDHLCTRRLLQPEPHNPPSDSLTSAPPAAAHSDSPAQTPTVARQLALHQTPQHSPSHHRTTPVQHPTQIARLRHLQLHDSWPFIKPRNTLHPTTGPHPCSSPLR